ncbi:MAG: hypothetical protein ACREVL_15725 [Solimonas sp.]
MRLALLSDIHDKLPARATGFASAQAAARKGRPDRAGALHRGRVA